MTEPSTGPDRTSVEDVPVPRPGAGEIAIDVAHAGVNFLDVMARRGDPGYTRQWPYAPGLEVAGTVREVGGGVAGLAAGQRVTALLTGGGGLAEVAVADAALVVPVPDDMPSLIAAAAPVMLTTALLLLTDVARFRPGETVLMHSASGGVGSAVAQLVPALGGGLRIGTVGRPEKVADARRRGWDAALVRDEGLAEAVRAEVARRTDSRADGGVDVVLDPSGTALLDLDLDLVAAGGRIVLFGNPGGGRPDPLPPLGRLIGGNVGIAGFSITRLAAAAPWRVTAGLRRIVNLLSEGRLDLEVTEVGSLAEVPGVHDLLAQGRGGGKYVVSVGADVPGRP